MRYIKDFTFWRCFWIGLGLTIIISIIDFVSDLMFAVFGITGILNIVESIIEPSTGIIFLILLLIIGLILFLFTFALIGYVAGKLWEEKDG